MFTQTTLSTSVTDWGLNLVNKLCYLNRLLFNVVCNIEDSFFAVEICLNFALLADLIGDVDAGLLPAFSDGASYSSLELIDLTLGEA